MKQNYVDEDILTESKHWVLFLAMCDINSYTCIYIFPLSTKTVFTLQVQISKLPKVLHWLCFFSTYLNISYI